MRIISYNAKKGTLQGYKYENNNCIKEWIVIDEINANSNYRLTISIHGQSNQVSVNKYKCDSTCSE